MDYFDFTISSEGLDHRSIFVNRVCKLIYNKHNGDLDKSIEEGEIYFKDFDAHIRNVYELVENEIPLWGYFMLINNGAENYGYNEAEYNEVLAKTKEACKLYYE